MKFAAATAVPFIAAALTVAVAIPIETADLAARQFAQACLYDGTCVRSPAIPHKRSAPQYAIHDGHIYVGGQQVARSSITTSNGEGTVTASSSGNAPPPSSPSDDEDDEDDSGETTKPGVVIDNNGITVSSGEGQTVHVPRGYASACKGGVCVYSPPIPTKRQYAQACLYDGTCVRSPPIPHKRSTPQYAIHDGHIYVGGQQVARSSITTSNGEGTVTASSSGNAPPPPADEDDSDDTTAPGVVVDEDGITVSSGQGQTVHVPRGYASACKGGVCVYSPPIPTKRQFAQACLRDGTCVRSPAIPSRKERRQFAQACLYDGTCVRSPAIPGRM